MLNNGQLDKLESVQRLATKIVLGAAGCKMSYTQRLDELKIERLRDRWEQQFQKLATKSERQQCFAQYFLPNPNTHTMGLRNKRKYYQVVPSTERFKNSPVNQAIALVNRCASNYRSNSISCDFAIL